MGFKKSTACLASTLNQSTKSLKVLDVGCGERIYEHIFPGSEYIGIDVEVSGRSPEYKKPDKYFNGFDIPFPDKTFDVILCTEVIEHCSSPEKLVKEIYRVLKPNGELLLTVPFIWGEHEAPYDFRRYTSWGVQRLLKDTGFKIRLFQKDQCGFAGLFKLSASEVTNNINNNKSIRRFAAIAILKLMYLFIERILRVKADRIYITNQIIAEK